jgi:hypothetical protein
VLLLLALGCTGKDEPLPSDPDDTVDDTVDDTDADTDIEDTDVEDTDIDTDLPELTWADMDATQRSAYMSDTVMPRMKALFEGFDPAYSTMTCTTCHGTGGESNGWAMPNGLHPIDTVFFPLPEKWGSPEEEALSLFMLNDVTETMAELLDQPLFDQNDPLGGGFGCFSCHEVGETGN